MMGVTILSPLSDSEPSEVNDPPSYPYIPPTLRGRIIQHMCNRSLESWGHRRSIPITNTHSIMTISYKHKSVNFHKQNTHIYSHPGVLAALQKLMSYFLVLSTITTTFRVSDRHLDFYRNKSALPFCLFVYTCKYIHKLNHIIWTLYFWLLLLMISSILYSFPLCEYFRSTVSILELLQILLL